MTKDEQIYYRIITDRLEKEFPHIFETLHEFTAIDHYRDKIGLESFWYSKMNKAEVEQKLDIEFDNKLIYDALQWRHYEDLISQLFRRIAVDGGYLDNEIKETLLEAKEEIIKLRSNLQNIKNVVKDLIRE